jgi:hypothetical protein
MTNALSVPPGAPVGSSPLVDLFRVMGTVCLLLGVAWIALYWLRDRPWIKGTLQRRMRLRVEETRPIGNRALLHLVACGDQQFLVASSPSGVSLIADVMPGDSVVVGDASVPRFDEVLRGTPPSSGPSQS